MSFIRSNGLKDVLNQITSNGGTVDYMTHDVTSEQDWNALVKKTIELYGAIHIIANNAGITGNIMRCLEETSINAFKKVVDINQLSQFIGIKAVVPHMKQTKGGLIINISSIAGIVGSAKATEYTTSKGAAAEFAEDNIRVNSVHPGYVDSPLTKGRQNPEEFKKKAIGFTPMGREVVPDEVASGILYLASDEISYTTGSEMMIDGINTAV